MKSVIGLILLLVGVMVFAAWSTKPDNLSSLFQTRSSTPEPTGQLVKIGDAEFQLVGVADTSSERQTGLSNYDSLDQDEGLLFVCRNEEDCPAFWMKGMKFPIDIIWIREDKVSQITADVPTVVSGTPDTEIPRYTSDDPPDYVLEVAAGASRSKGVELEDPVSLEL